MFTSGQRCSHLIHTYHHDQDVCHEIHNLLIALSMMFSASAFAAKQITLEESANYTKLGDLSIQQTGVPTVGHKYISSEVDKKMNSAGWMGRIASIASSPPPGKRAITKISTWKYSKIAGWL